MLYAELPNISVKMADPGGNMDMRPVRPAQPGYNNNGRFNNNRTRGRYWR